MMRTGMISLRRNQWSKTMATSAIETAKQENGSRFYLENVIEKNREPSYTEMT